MRGSLFIISAPSGAGKTTLCRKLSLIFPNLRNSVSYTTRPARPEEVNNRDYTFISRSMFLKMTRKGGFVEWAKVHGYLYGTSKKRLEAMLNKGIDVMLDIDVQGARQIKRRYKNGIYVFILPPSMKILRERLNRRRSNSREEIESRLKKAADEIKDYKKYDYVIINNVIEDAVEGLKAIILAGKLRSSVIDSLWITKKFLLPRSAHSSLCGKKD